MNTGDIVLIPFPFAEFTHRKVRPSVVVSETKDHHADVVLCAISSVVPPFLTENEILLQSGPENGLRRKSILKVDRIVTAKSQDVIAKLGKLDQATLEIFRMKFKSLVD